MSKYYELKIPKLKHSEVAKEVHNLFNEITNLYFELSNKYTDLNIALTEMELSKNDDIDTYVHAINKINFLMDEIPELLDKEQELYTKNIEYFPYLLSFIKKVYNIKDLDNVNSFSFFDTLIDPNFKEIKNNVIIVCILRAMKYYSAFNENYFDNILDPYVAEDSDYLRDQINYDYSDIETINTLSLIKTTYENEEFGKLIYNKYKCIFMFTNPLIEHFYLNADIDAVHPYFVCHFEDQGLKEVETSVVKTLIAIQQNKLINLDDNKDIVNDKLTAKQRMDVLLHYDNESSVYDSRFEKLKHDYDDNMEEIGLLLAYFHQALISLDEQAIEDLDHLFSVMVNEESPVTYGSVKLSKKVVDHFFNKDEILSEKQKESGHQRTRSSENDKNEDE